MYQALYQAVLLYTVVFILFDKVGGRFHFYLSVFTKAQTKAIYLRHSDGGIGT